MVNLNIADLNIAVHGADYESFKSAMAKYVSDSDAKPDATVTFRQCEDISVEGLRPFRSHLGRNRYIDGEFQGFYDYIDELDKVVTHVRTDMGRKNITFDYYDTTAFSDMKPADAMRNFMSVLFRSIILSNDGVVVHASTIVYNGEAVTFTAASGTGKSTHTGLWKKYYPDTVIINDDCPAIRFRDGKAWAYGTPWSGKTDINENMGAPLKAMVFIERSEVCSITEISPMEAFVRMIGELPKPIFKNQSDQMMDVLNKLFSTVPCYLLKCDISKTAVDTVRNKIFN